MTRPRLSRDAVAAALVFVACFAIFRTAPVSQAGADSRYSMLLSENLLRHRQFALERYDLPRPDYRLIESGGHLYYMFPPGTSVLSIPYLVVAHLAGKAAVRGDGRYDPDGEAALEKRLAALLMAAFACVAYLTARLLLPVGWSLTVTFAAAFGTQVLSTMSRAMWSDTWGVLLVGLAAYLLLHSAVRGRALNVGLLATIESWAYDRAAYELLGAAGISGLPCVHSAEGAVEIRARDRRMVGAVLRAVMAAVRPALAALLPRGPPPVRRRACGVAGESGQPEPWPPDLRSADPGGRPGAGSQPARATLPPAGRAGRIRDRGAPGGAGRVPALVGGPLLRGAPDRLAGPLIVVLAVLAVDAFRASRASPRPAPPAQPARPLIAGAPVIATAGLLAALSVAINAAGAYSRATAEWNVTPTDIDQSPQRLWSVRGAQALAAFVARDARASKL